MATTNLLPRATGGGESLAYDGWTKSTGSVAYSLLDDPVGSPVDTDFVSINNTTSLQAVFITDWSLGAATISAVNVKIRAKSQFSSGLLNVHNILNGGAENSGAANISLTTSFANYTVDITSLRPGGGSWTTADLASFQVAWIKPSGGSNTITVSQVYVEVTYTASTSLTANQSAYAKAYDTNPLGSQNAYVRAYDILLGSQASYIAGYDTIRGSQNAYINGLGTVVPNQPAYAVAYDTLRGNQSAYMAGFLTINGNQPAFIRAFDSIVGYQSAYIVGITSGFTQLVGSQSGFIRAFQSTTGFRFAYASAYTGTFTGMQNAYVIGGGFSGLIIGNQNAFVRAFDTLRGNQSAFVRAYETIRGSQSGYAAGFSTNPLGSQNAFIKAFGTLRGSQAAFTQGPYQSYGMQLAYAKGQGGSRLKYRLSAIEGPPNGSWTKIFKEISETGTDVLRAGIGDNEILATLETFSEQHARSENVTMTVFSCPVPSTSLNPSTGLKPC